MEEDSDNCTVLFGSLLGSVTVRDRGKTGFDSLLVLGTPGPDTFVITATTVERAPERIDYFGIERLTVNGHTGDDRFVVNASGASELTLGQEGSDTCTVFLGSLVGTVKG